MSILNAIGFFRSLEKRLGVFVSSRKLTKYEIEELVLVFGNCTYYSKIRIIENSKLAKFGAKISSSPHLGFVLLNVIHFSRVIETKTKNDMSWLAHELMHVLQYNAIGVVYIPMALRAQKNGGYSYKTEWLKYPLKSFNLEQQGDIVKHYYLALKNKTDTGSFQKIVKEIESEAMIPN